ncbi:hypothetical protein [Asaccharospora irregularis]|uniref:Uncharacterized protein n=1 Tax=Asaccharospora irregularis DSM 2635 TaxID=1121321 RepID=A0A1M5SFP4_9FIRM|nr:hypothetical protein [Asaccharospora irregularis]SHH37311.1 hypothetical protein SAMN04488530_14017 [Asaccharospora irregularis DSM 2635]
MNIYFKSSRRKKSNQTNIPNIMAFNIIRDFLRNEDHGDTRKKYFIKDLDNSQVNQTMRDIKWLFKKYKGLEVINIEYNNGNVTKIRL